ncbi:hypothetical protein QF032_002871 [Streptomyces achromogenes]|nr:hypothetical protein [Streptomyces achromogenes]
MSSDDAYSSFIRSTSVVREKLWLSLPVPCSVGALAVAAVGPASDPATVTDSPRSSSVSSARSSRLDQRRRERISRAPRRAAVYASK